MSRLIQSIPTKFCLKSFLILSCFYHVQISPCCAKNSLENLATRTIFSTSHNCFATSPETQLQSLHSWVKPLLITLSICVCAALAGQLLYRYFNPSDEYYINWTEKIEVKLKNKKTTLQQLKNSTDEDTMVDTLLKLIFLGEKDYNTIELFDIYLKKIQKEILNITKQIKKRIDHRLMKHETPNQLLIDCLNTLTTWLSLIEQALQIKEKYGCLVNLYLLHAGLSSYYSKELSGEDTTINTLIQQKLQNENLYYDSYVNTLITYILELEKNLTCCLHIKLKPQWIKNAFDLSSKLKDLAQHLMISEEYLKAVKETNNREYWRGYNSRPPVIISYPVYHSYPVYYSSPTYYYYHRY